MSGPLSKAKWTPCRELCAFHSKTWRRATTKYRATAISSCFAVDQTKLPAPVRRCCCRGGGSCACTRSTAASSARREYFCTRWAFYHPAIAFVVRALYGPLKRAPGIHAAVERVHAHDPPPLQQQRRTGAGSFVWSTAKQDDIAVARYFVVARLLVFEGNAQSSRHGVHFAFESGPDIHHHDLFAGFQLGL